MYSELSRCWRMIGLSIIPFIALLLIFLGSHVSEAFDHRYRNGDTVPIYVNKVRSYSYLGSEEYHYYDLPFCSQDKMLDRNNLALIPYKIEFLVDKQFDLLCKKTLSKTDVSKFRNMIKKDYRMQFYLDDLPMWAFVGRDDTNHRDMIIKTEYFLYKHYDFILFYHNGTVLNVFIEVDAAHMVNITVEMEVDVQFTYSVKWFLTQPSYDKRVEKYTNYSSVHVENNVFRYSIANSCFTILILIICLLVFYIRVLRKVISRYACDIEEAGIADNQYETGWKNIHGDVFRFPKHKSLFSAALGSGTQMLLLMAAVLVLGAMDVFQLYLPGVFTNAVAIVYALTSVVSGCISTSFYHQLEGTRWIRNILLTGALYFGPLSLTFVVNYTVAIYYESTSAFPLGEIIKLSLLWIFLALPLLILGAVIGKNSVSDFQSPCRTTKCPKEVPRLSWYRGVLPQMVLAGFSPFSVIIIQIHDILSAVRGYRIYTSYDYMLIMFFLLLIMIALVSVVMTYFQLAAQDHEWWWRSFFCGGSTGLYVYAYSVYYSLYRSKMNSFMQTAFFLGYMACLGYGIFLALGTVGFYASLLFVRYLYASIKCN